MLTVFRLVFAKDQDIVQVDYTCDVQELTKHLVNEGLKHSRSIHETERHSKIFKQTELCSEHCFPLIFTLNLYSIICILAVQLSELLSSLETIQHV